MESRYAIQLQFLQKNPKAMRFTNNRSQHRLLILTLLALFSAPAFDVVKLKNSLVLDPTTRALVAQDIESLLLEARDVTLAVSPLVGCILFSGALLPHVTQATVA